MTILKKYTNQKIINDNFLTLAIKELFEKFNIIQLIIFDL